MRWRPQEVRHHICRRVAKAPLQETRDPGQVITTGHEGGFGAAVSPELWVAGGGHESIAETAPTNRVLDRAPLGHILLLGFGGAAEADPSIFAPIRDAQVPQVADPFTRSPARWILVPLNQLERIAGRGGARIGADRHRAGGGGGEYRALEWFRQPRFVAVGEQRAHLHPGGPAGPGRGQLIRVAGTPGNPERQAQLTDLVQVHHVTLAVDRLPLVRESQLPAGRSIVASRRRPLDHEAVHSAGRFSGQDRGQQVARDDGNEPGPHQGGRWRRPVRHRVELEVHRGGRGGILQFKAQPRRLVPGKTVQRTGNLPGDPSPHDHRVHARQHGAIQGGERRQLNLGEEVDSYRLLVPLPGQEHLDEGGQHRQLLALHAEDRTVQGEQPVRFVRPPATRNPEALQDPLRHPGKRKCRHGPAKIAPLVAVLQTPHQNGVNTGPGDHAELPGPRHRVGQPPVGNGRAHTTLDDGRESVGGQHSQVYITCR